MTYTADVMRKTIETHWDLIEDGSKTRVSVANGRMSILTIQDSCGSIVKVSAGVYLALLDLKDEIMEAMEQGND